MFKNREIRLHMLLVILVLSAMCAGAAALRLNGVYAVLLTGLALGLIWWLFTVKRYHHMQNMIEELDRILHGSGNVSLSDYKEGELSLLRNELSKMTLMLQRQAEQLGEDKLQLADSLADISHQIRTPLTSLNLMLASLKKEELSPQKRSETLFEMNRQLERIDRLVATLLKLAKMDAGTIKLKSEPVKLDELVTYSLQPLEIMLELKGITIEKNISGSYNGDMTWSSEALANILKNCMEHTPDGGRIQINGHENTVYTEIIIEDNGSGITTEDMPHIFERFYKGAGSDSGSYGIGLALARTIISGQNGIVNAENVIDAAGDIHGARFTIRFYKSIV